MLSETDMVVLLKIKDADAFSCVYDKYAPPLYRLICKLTHNSPASGHLLQESFVTIWRDIDSYNASTGRLFSWMLRITLQQCNRVVALPHDLLAQLMPKPPGAPPHPLHLTRL